MLKAKTGQDLKLNVVQNMKESSAQFFLLEHESRLANSNRNQNICYRQRETSYLKIQQKSTKGKKPQTLCHHFGH